MTKKKTRRPVLKKKAKKQTTKTKYKAKVVVKKMNKTEIRKVLDAPSVRNLLVDLAGEKAPKIIHELTSPMSDEQLAGAAKLKISEVRAVLNKLHSLGITTYDRTRDKDSGWFSYTWNVALDQVKDVVSERRALRATNATGFEVTTAASSQELYACGTCFYQTGTKLVFDKAAELGFKCPDCAQILKYVEHRGSEVVLR